MKGRAGRYAAPPGYSAGSGRSGARSRRCRRADHRRRKSLPSGIPARTVSSLLDEQRNVLRLVIGRHGDAEARSAWLVGFDLRALVAMAAAHPCPIRQYSGMGSDPSGRVEAPIYAVVQRWTTKGSDSVAIRRNSIASDHAKGLPGSERPRIPWNRHRIPERHLSPAMPPRAICRVVFCADCGDPAVPDGTENRRFLVERGPAERP